MLVNLFEPYRSEVERALCDFDEETQSWRDYSGIVGPSIPDDVYAAGAEFVQAVSDEQ